MLLRCMLRTSFAYCPVHVAHIGSMSHIFAYCTGACGAHCLHVAHIGCMFYSRAITGACCAHPLHIAHIACMLIYVACCIYMCNHRCILCKPVQVAHSGCILHRCMLRIFIACCTFFFLEVVALWQFAHLANACFKVVAFESCCILCNLRTLPMLGLLHCYVCSVVASNIFIVPPSYVLWHDTSRLR